MTPPQKPTAVKNYSGKRLFDLAAATFGVVVLSPILLAAALAVAISSRGPMLFTAERVGRHGKLIEVHKFRSMRHSTNGPAITSSRDPRVTAVGRLLRALKIDELPQLFDVIGGSMSLVGPRPEDPSYVDQYSDDERLVLSWRPGITSPASIQYRNEEQLLAAAPDLDIAYRAVSRDKIAIDIDYFRRATMRSDVSVILRTFGAVVHRSDIRPSEIRATQ